MFNCQGPYILKEYVKETTLCHLGNYILGKNVSVSSTVHDSSFFFALFKPPFQFPLTSIPQPSPLSLIVIDRIRAN